MQHQTPVTEFVAEAFDHQGSIRRHLPGGILLLTDELDQVGSRVVIEPAHAATLDDVGFVAESRFADELPQRLSEFGGATESVAVPEGQTTRHAVGGADQNPIEGDLLDPPTGGAERKDVADPGFVDHFLVEFADAGRFLANHVDGEEAAVGDCAAGSDGQTLRTRAARERVGLTIPDKART